MTNVEAVVKRSNGRWVAREVEISGGGGEHGGGDDRAPRARPASAAHRNYAERSPAVARSLADERPGVHDPRPRGIVPQSVLVVAGVGALADVLRHEPLERLELLEELLRRDLALGLA